MVVVVVVSVKILVFSNQYFSQAVFFVNTSSLLLNQLHTITNERTKKKRYKDGNQTCVCECTRNKLELTFVR